MRISDWSSDVCSSDLEIVPVTIKGRKGDTVVDQDEYIRHGATLDSVKGLRPAFQKDGTVMAANASGINDGAAAVVMLSAEEARKRGTKPLARNVSWARAGVDPSTKIGQARCWHR